MKRATTAEWNRTTDTGAAWREYLLRQAEIGVEVFTDNTVKFKIGDGINPWYLLPYASGDSAKFVTSLPPLNTAIINTFYVLGKDLFYTPDNKSWIEIGGGAIEFNELLNRPKYNGVQMTSKTNIPKVPTTASDLKYVNTTSKLAATNTQAAIDELNNKLKNSMQKLTTPNILYGNDATGNIKAYPYSTTKTNNSIAMRTNYGTVKGQDPIEADDYVTKQFHDTAINPIKTNINNLQTNIKNVSDKVTTLEGRVSVNETNINANATNISNLTNQVNTNKSDITVIKTDITELENRIDSLDTSSGGLADKIATNTKNISQLQTDLSNEISARQGQEVISIESGLGSNKATIRLTKKNGTQISTNLPIASANQNGLMPSSSFTQITQNANDIAALKSQGGRYIGISFDTYADLQLYTIPSTVKQSDFTYVSKDETHKNGTSLYVYDGSKFVFAYQIEHELPSIANLTTLGLVLSSTKDGEILVENDGKMSLNGYDNIISSLNNKVDKVSGKGLSTNDFTNSYKDKVNLIETTGDGTTFLGNDGQYHTINIPEEGIKDIQIDGNSVVDSITKIANLHTIANTGNYNDLVGIPTDLVRDPNYVHTDLNFTQAYAQKILTIDTTGNGNKFLTDNGTYTYLSDVAGTGSYNDLLDVPTDLVRDADYVHTDNNFTNELKTKLDLLDTAGEENVIESISVNNNQLAPDSSKNVNIDLTPYALEENVPTKLSQLINDNHTVTDEKYVHTDANFTTALKTKLEGIDASADVNKIEIVKVDGTPLAINSSDKSVNIALAGFAVQSDLDELSAIVATNKTNIQSLQSGGIWRGLFDTYADLPKKTPNASFIGGQVDLNDYIIIKEDENVLDYVGEPCKTRYYATAIDASGNITWTYFDKEEGSIAIATNTSLGTVMGTADSDTTKGKISVGLDGTMSLNGYDELIAKFGNYIPMTGTTSTKPITGTLTFGNNVGGLYGKMGDSDFWRILARGASDAGFLEIATGDNGDDPIYFRQIKTTSGTETTVHQVTLMDKTGSTTLAGHLYLPGVADATYNSKSKIIFGDTTNQYACIRANTNNAIVFSNHITNNDLALEYFPAEGYKHLGPVTAGALSLGTTERWWDNIRGVRLYGGSGTASHIVLGGGANKYTWIDNRDSTETSVRSNILLCDDGVVGLGKGKLGFASEGNDIHKAKIQYNSDEKALEFVFA